MPQGSIIFLSAQGRELEKKREEGKKREKSERKKRKKKGKWKRGKGRKNFNTSRRNIII